MSSIVWVACSKSASVPAGAVLVREKMLIGLLISWWFSSTFNDCNRTKVLFLPDVSVGWVTRRRLVDRRHATRPPGPGRRGPPARHRLHLGRLERSGRRVRGRGRRLAGGRGPGVRRRT